MSDAQEINKHWGLSETDCKLLLAFTEEQVLRDGLLIAGVPYEYGRSRVTKLKNRGFIQERRVGREIYLSCARRAETEFLWEMALTKTNKGKGFYFRFAGQQRTAQEAMIFMKDRFNAIHGARHESLRHMTGVIIRCLTVGSHKLSKGELVTLTPKKLMSKLDEHIRQTELELQFAKALRAHGLLWNESPTVWQSITFGKEPSEASYKEYNDMEALEEGREIKKVIQESKKRDEPQIPMVGKMAPPGPNAHWRDSNE